MIRPTRLALALTVSLALANSVSSQGRLVVERVHGASLEDTVTGEASERTVATYLPPSYAASPDRRYPVLYLLHGIGGTHADWIRSGDKDRSWQAIQGVMDRGIARGSIAEIIVVAPDQMTRGGGSFYTNSEVTGRWEDFTVVDLVRHTDASYRTIPRAAARGIAGHSMGGYGALKLAMKHPDVYQVVYGMNSALLGFAGDLLPENAAFERALRARPETMNPRVDFYVPSIWCVAQAFSPNPENAPFFADLPYQLVDGRLRVGPAHERWREQMLLHMVEDYRDNLLALGAIRFDSGRFDQYTHIPPTNVALSDKLVELGVPHVFEDYNGDHRDRIWGEEGRLATEILPFFSRKLERAHVVPAIDRPRTVREEIVAMFDAWAEARVAFDRETMEAILAPDAYVLVDDRKISREEFLGMISQPRAGSRLVRFDVEVLTLQQTSEGWTAVVAEKVEYRATGPDGESQTAYGFWVTRDDCREDQGKWRVTKSEAIGRQSWRGTQPPFLDW